MFGIGSELGPWLATPCLQKGLRYLQRSHRKESAELSPSGEIPVLEGLTPSPRAPTRFRSSLRNGSRNRQRS